VRCAVCGTTTVSSDSSDATTAAVSREREEKLREALHAYALAYPCPGFEVAYDSGDLSGCTGEYDDCPTCEAVALAENGEAGGA
jgi:hypothetical protein